MLSSVTFCAPKSMKPWLFYTRFIKTWLESDFYSGYDFRHVNRSWISVNKYIARIDTNSDVDESGRSILARQHPSKEDWPKWIRNVLAYQKKYDVINSSVIIVFLSFFCVMSIALSIAVIILLMRYAGFDGFCTESTSQKKWTKMSE